MSEKFIPALDAQQCHRLLVIAHSRARAIGLAGDDPDDCALAFVGHLLRQVHQDPHTTLPNLQSSPWLFHCADNWAKDYARQHRRRRACEETRIQEAPERNECHGQEFLSELADPQQSLPGQESYSYLDIALSRLTPVQRELFRRRCLEGETLIHLGETRGRSAEAIRQSSCLLRRRLQTLLMETGFSQREAIDYLYQMLSSPPWESR